MVIAVHALLHAHDADAARAFFRDVLGFPAVEAGHGGESWLILTLPPAELGIHPADPGDLPPAALYLMCDDIDKTVAELSAKGAHFTTPVSDQGWGRLTVLKVPGAADIGLYQPRHKTAYRT